MSEKIEKTERENPEPSKCLGIFNLSFETTERDLNDLFFRYGKIEDITLVLDKVTNKSRGFAFVYFKEIEDAEVAKEKIHGMIVHGKELRVDFSITEGPHPPTPGEYKGTKALDKRRKPFRGGGVYSRGGRRDGRPEGSRDYDRDRSPVRSRYNDDYSYDRRETRYDDDRRPKDWTDYYQDRRREPVSNRIRF